MSIKLFSLTLVLLQFGGLLYASIPACDELCREMHRITAVQISCTPSLEPLSLLTLPCS